MLECSEEVRQAVRRSSAILDERAGVFVGRKDARERLSGWLARRPRLGDHGELISPLFVVLGPSGIGKTRLVAEETQAWSRRTGGQVWWLRAPQGLTVDGERDLFLATLHADGRCCARDGGVEVGGLTPLQAREQMRGLGIVRAGMLVLDGVTKRAEIEHFRRLGFGRVVVTTNLEAALEGLPSDAWLRLLGLSYEDAMGLLHGLIKENPEFRAVSLELHRVVTEADGNPQRLLTLFRGARVEGDLRLAQMFTVLAVAPPVTLDITTVSLLSGRTVSEVQAGLALLKKYGCLQPALPDDQCLLHSEVRRSELQRLQDDGELWAEALGELLAGLNRLFEHLQSLVSSGSDETALRLGVLRELVDRLIAEDTFRTVGDERRLDVARLLLVAHQHALLESPDQARLERLLAAAEGFAKGDPSTRSACLLERGKLCAHRCDWDRARELFDGAAELALQVDDRLRALEALICGAEACLALGLLQAAKERYDRGRAAQRGLFPLDEPDFEAIARLAEQLTLLGVKLAYDSRRVPGGASVSKLIQQLEALLTYSAQDRPIQWDAKLLLVDLLLSRCAVGDLDRALAVCELALSQPQGGASGAPAHVLAKFLLLRGMVHLHQRALGLAYEDVRQAERAARRLHETELHIDSQLLLVEILIERRQLDKAREVAALLLVLLENSPPGAPWEASALLVAARAARACGDLRAAEDYINRAAELLNDVDLSRARDTILLEKARVLVLMREFAKARGLMEQVLRGAREVGDERTQVDALIELLRMREWLTPDELPVIVGELRELLRRNDSPLAAWELRRLEPEDHPNVRRGASLGGDLWEAIFCADEALSEQATPSERESTAARSSASPVDREGCREVTFEQSSLDSMDEGEFKRDALLSVYLYVRSGCRVPWILLAWSSKGISYRVYDCARTRPFPASLGEGTWGDARKFIVELITTLQTIHWLGYCHGELTERNVRVDSERRPVLLGFSAARSDALVRAASERAEQRLGVGDAVALARMMDRWLRELSTQGVAGRAFVLSVPLTLREGLTRIRDEGGTLAELLTLITSTEEHQPARWLVRPHLLDELTVTPPTHPLVRVVGQAGSGRGSFVLALEERLQRISRARVLTIERPLATQTAPLENVRPPLDDEERRTIPATSKRTRWADFAEQVATRMIGELGDGEGHDNTNINTLFVLIPRDDETPRLDSATSCLIVAFTELATRFPLRVAVIRCGSPGERLPDHHVIELHNFNESELERLFVTSSQEPNLVRLAARALFVRTAGHPRSSLQELRRWVSLGWATYDGGLAWSVGTFGLAALEADPVLTPAEEPPPEGVNPSWPLEAREVLALLRLAGPGYPISRLYKASDLSTGARVLFLVENLLERHGLVRTNLDRSSFVAVLPYTLPGWTRADVNKRLVRLAAALDPTRDCDRRFWLYFQACDEAAFAAAVAWASALRRESKPEQVPMVVRVALMLLDRLANQADGESDTPRTFDDYRLQLLEQWVMSAIDALSAAELAHAISELARVGAGHGGLIDLRRFAVAYRTARFERPSTKGVEAAFDELDALVGRIIHPDLSRVLRFSRLIRPTLTPAARETQLDELRRWAHALPDPEERRRNTVKIENRAGDALYFRGCHWEALWRYERHRPADRDKSDRIQWLISLARTKVELFDRRVEALAHINEAKQLLRQTPSPGRSLELDFVRLIWTYRFGEEYPSDQTVASWEELEQRYSELLLHERLHYSWLQYAAVLYRCSSDPDREPRARDAFRERARLFAARIVPKSKKADLSVPELIAKGLQLACGAPMEESEVVNLLQQTERLTNAIAAIEIFGLFGHGLRSHMRPLWRSLQDQGDVSLKPYEALLRRMYSVGARRHRLVALSISESLQAWEGLNEYGLIRPLAREPLTARLQRFFADAFTPMEIVELVKGLANTVLPLDPEYMVATHGALMERAVDLLSSANKLPDTLAELVRIRPARMNEIEYMRSLLPTL